RAAAAQADSALPGLDPRRQCKVRRRRLARLLFAGPDRLARMLLLRRAAIVDAWREHQVRHVLAVASARRPAAAGKLDGGEPGRRRHPDVLRRPAVEMLQAA